jgi:hypothetical protein
MTIKRIASLFALTAAIAAAPAVASSTSDPISPMVATAQCTLDGVPFPCEPFPGENCDPKCDVRPTCRVDCDFPLSDVPREQYSTTSTTTRPRGRG